MKKHRSLENRERRRRGTIAIAVGAAASLGLGSSALAVTFPQTDSVSLWNNAGTTELATATCTTNLVSCTGNGGFYCEINKMAGAAEFHLKWRLNLDNDGNPFNGGTRTVPTQTDVTGWKTLFVHSSKNGVESDLDGFPNGHDAQGNPVTFYTLASGEYIHDVEWKLCDDGTGAGGTGPICNMQTNVISYKC